MNRIREGIKLIGETGCILCLFFIQYYVMMWIFPQYVTGYGTNEGNFIFGASAVLCVSVIGLINKFKFSKWLFADIVYFIFVLLFVRNGQYNIGKSGIDLDGMRSFLSQDWDVLLFGAIISTVLMLFYQIITLTVVYLAKHIYKKLKQR